MDAHESDPKAPHEPREGGGRDHRQAGPHHSWNEATRPKPVPPASTRASAIPMNSIPSPEAFGRGVLENAPEAFGCPDARRQEENGEQEESEQKEKDDEKSGDKKDSDNGEKKKSDDKKDEKKDKKEDDEKKPKKLRSTNARSR